MDHQNKVSESHLFVVREYVENKGGILGELTLFFGEGGKVERKSSC